MKAIAVLLLFMGMFMVVQGYYAQKQACPAPPPVQIKYIPRSAYDEMLAPDGSQIEKQFKGMFEDVDPLIELKK